MSDAAEHFTHVTEMPGDSVSPEQIERMVNRYAWAAQYAAGKDVLEAACGSGQGLPLLNRVAKSLVAGDYSEAVLNHTRRLSLPGATVSVFDAQEIPYPAASFDVVIMFEAIYYVPDPMRFFSEAHRVLRPGGVLLLATANKDLYDFNPSPHSHRYFGVVEFSEVLPQLGFIPEFFGDILISTVSMRQKVLRPVKAMAAKLNLIPKSMTGKALLKKIFFGQTVTLPSVLGEGHQPTPPTRLAGGAPDHEHKVILCAAVKPLSA